MFTGFLKNKSSLAILFACLCLSLGISASELKKVYTSSSDISISNDFSQNLKNTFLDNIFVSFDIENIIDTYKTKEEIYKFLSVNFPGLEKDKNINISLEKNSLKKIKISVETKRALQSQTIANRYAAFLVEEVQNSLKRNIEENLNKLRLEALKTEKKLNTLSEKFLEIETSSDIQEVFQKKLLLEQLQNSRKQIEEHLATIRASKESPVALSNYINSFTDTKELEKRLNETKQLLEQETLTLGPKHPKIRDLSDKLNQIERTYAKRIVKIKNERALSEINLTNEKNSILKKELKLKNELILVQDVVEQYENTKNTIKQISENLESTNSELNLGKIYLEGRYQLASITDTATRPEFNYKNFYLKNVGLYLIISILCSIFINLIRFKLKRKIKTKEDVLTFLDTELIANIPSLSNLKEEKTSETKLIELNTITDQESIIALKVENSLLPSINVENDNSKDKSIYLYAQEELRNLKSKLLSDPSKKNQTIMITSPTHGEGKSMLALNLATSFANSKKRTLLLETGSRVKKNSNALGITDYIQGNANVSDILVQTNVPYLHTISIGTDIKKFSDLVCSNKFEELIKSSRLFFDHIIIDTTATLPWSENNIIANLSDSILLIHNPKISNKEEVTSALEKLRNSKTEVKGLVLNEVKINKENLRYYH